MFWTPVEDKIRTAIHAFLRKEPFFAHLMYSLDIVESKDKDINIATDGYRLVYNRDFIKSLSPQHMEGVLGHEALHIALMHHVRRGHRDNLLWQVAADCVVNLILKNNGYILPTGTIDPAVFNTMPFETTEEVYERLEKQFPPDKRGEGGKSPPQPQWGGVSEPQSGDGDQDGDNDGDQDGEGKDGKDKKDKGQSPGQDRQPTPEERADAERRVMAAIEKAKEAGKMPGDIERMIDETFFGKRDWKDSLRKFLNGGEERVPTWSRPSRRFIWQDIYMPGPTKYGPGEIAVLIDTSGSIDDSLLNKFAAELRKIGQDTMPDRIHVACVDTMVQWTGSFGPHEDIEIQPRGRGGTDFRPAFRWVEENCPNVKACVHFTDTFGTYPDHQPHFPVLTVVWPGTGGQCPKWSERVDMV